MARQDRSFRSTTDRDFDEIAHRFCDNIYGNLKGRIRLEVLQRDFEEAGVAGQTEQPLRILDAGGGMGQFSLRLAASGHNVVLADPSSTMLELAETHRQTQAPGVPIEYLHASVQNLPVSLGKFDLVLFHAVLEWLVAPRETLEQLLTFLRPGGHLSLLFYNRQGLIMRHLTLGNFHYIENNYLSGMGKKSLTPISPQVPDEVRNWFVDWGYQELCFSGVRCFHDLMLAPERQRCQDEDLVRLELRHSRLSPYRDIARYIHLLLRKG